MLTALDYLRACIERAPFIPYPWDHADKNVGAFRSKEEFTKWYCQPPGDEPYRDRGFYSRELAMISMTVRPRTIVEFGTGLGISTCLLDWLNPKAEITTIDTAERAFLPSDPPQEVQVGFLAKYQKIWCNYIKGRSWEHVRQDGVDLCFVDGDHSYEAVIKDSLTAWCNRSRDHAWAIIWHDHNEQHPGVMRAVSVFCRSEGVELQSLPDSDTVWIMGGPEYENKVCPDCVEQALKGTDLAPWQQYFLSCFPREQYVPVPPYARYVPAMWRHATWEHLVTDTIKSNGTQMAALLSMAYKPKTIVEMGLDGGLTTLQFCKLNPQARVHGVDIRSRKWLSDIPIAFHALMNDVDNLSLHIMPSWEFSLPGQVDLCFIDGDHTGDTPYKDTERAWANRNLAGDWCIAWDDYHPSNPDVKNAVDRFCARVDMPLQKVGSWVYIGTIPDTELRKYGMQ